MKKCKSKKIKVFLLLIISCFVFSGCLSLQDAELEFYQSKGTKSTQYNGKEYLSNFDNWISVYLTLGNDISEYKSWSLQIKDANGTGDYYGSNACKTDCSEHFKNAGSGKIALYTGKNNIVKGKTYKVRFNAWSDEGYTGTKKTVQLRDLVTDGLPNTDPISVENITKILEANGATYVNKVNDVPKECSSYGLKSTEASIPACVALSQLTSSGIDCVSFAKKVYKISTGTNMQSFYSAFDGSKQYTSKSGDTSGLSSSKVYLMAQYNSSGDGTHASIVYYNHSNNTWYAVGGGFTKSKQVWNQTLKDTLDNSGYGWTYYKFRSF